VVVANDTGAEPYAKPRAAPSRVIAIVTRCAVDFVRVRTRAIGRIAHSDRALIAVIAGNKLAEALATPRNAQTWVPAGLTKGTVDLVGIGAVSIGGIAHVFGAIVTIAAIDFAAKLRVHAGAGLAPTRQTAEVAVRAVRSVRVFARAVCRIAQVLSAFLAVVAIDVHTKAQAQARRAPPWNAPSITDRTVADGWIETASVGRIAVVFGAIVAVVAIHELA
jgi:hypothetical protein